MLGVVFLGFFVVLVYNLIFDGIEGLNVVVNGEE